MEATLFTGWIYDELRPLAQELKVAHPAMLKAIATSKKKNDRIDTRKIADLLRCDLLPECYMASKACLLSPKDGRWKFGPYIVKTRNAIGPRGSMAQPIEAV